MANTDLVVTIRTVALQSATKTISGDLSFTPSEGMVVTFGPGLVLLVSNVRASVGSGNVQARAEPTRLFATLQDAQQFASDLQTRAQQLGLTVS